MAAIRDAVESLTADSPASRKSCESMLYSLRQLIGSSADPDYDTGFGLILDERNRRFFENQIQETPSDSNRNMKAETNSQKLILKAKQCLLRMLNERIERFDFEEKLKEIKNITKVFQKKFKLIYVETEEVNEAFVIFETLNARGKDLETADLLKNYFLQETIGQAHNDEILHSWTRMVDALRSRNCDATEYIKYFWNSQKKFSTEKELYRQITKSIVSSQNCCEFVYDLVKYVDLYCSMRKPQEGTFYSDELIRQKLINLDTLGARTYFPLVIAIQRKSFDEKDILRCLDMIEKLTFRNLTVCALKAGKLEKTFARIACDVSNGKKDAGYVLSELQKEIVDDVKFSGALKGLVIKKDRVSKYILREIEDFKNREKTTQKSMTLEHIMPKQVNSERGKSAWSVSRDFHEKNLERLANMTLLTGKWNTSLSNKPFTEKKNTYLKSELSITKQLSEYSQWTEKEMDDREQKLIELIMARWSIAE